METFVPHDVGKWVLNIMSQITPLLMPHEISADIEYDNPDRIRGYFISAVLIRHIDNQCLETLKIFVPHEVVCGY